MFLFVFSRKMERDVLKEREFLFFIHFAVKYEM